jgi:hypothetical protein
MTITLSIIGALVALAIALLVRPSAASAHCDTMDGPAVKDGELALRSGNVNIALKWVHPDGADELRRIFERAHAVRDRGEDVRAVVDQWFLENLVRIHRAAEGAPYTGLEPAGSHVDERVRAADEAVATGSLAALAPLVPEHQLPELELRLAEVQARSDFDPDDVEAGRDYLAAYVRFFKLAEGHGDDHHEHHEHHEARRSA